MKRALNCSIAVMALAVSASAVTFDFNSGGDGFVSSSNISFEGPWTHSSSAGLAGSGGWYTEGQVAQASGFCTTNLTSPTIVVGGTGLVTMSFDHRYSFEADSVNWDGGAVFVSVNAGAFVYLAGTSFTSNGYGGVVHNPGQPAFQSELADSEAFVGSSGGWINSVATLGTFNAGDVIKVQFKAAYDSNTSGGSPDWAIDNVNVATPVPEPITMILGAAGLAVAAIRKRRA